MHSYNSPHEQLHKSHRAPWLRAAVLGVNDGIVSTSSIMLGVLAASSSQQAILTAGVSGLVAGALSMGVGEYVSVSSQRDSEQADIDIEKQSIRDNPDEELAELVWIYEQRGLSNDLAGQVAVALHDHDAVAAHARDELGIDHESLANPYQAAGASMASFSIGAVLPIIGALIPTSNHGALTIVIISVLALGVSGAIGASIGGGHKVRAASRVLIGGSAAMALTAVIGHIIGRAL